MSVNDDGAENSEEIDIDDLSPEKLSSLFSWSEDEEESILEISEGEKREPSFGSLAREDAPEPTRDSVFEEDDSAPRRESAPTEEVSPPSFSPSPKKSKNNLIEDLRKLSLVGKIKNIRQRRQIKKEEAALGIDLSPPKKGEVVDPPSSFQELLQPLSDSELVLLQKDVQADDSVYVKIEKARSGGNTRQRWSIFITSIIAVLYFLYLGPEYLTETLPKANSGWLPGDLSANIRGQIVFALGLLFPVLSFFALSEGLRILFSFLSEGTILTLLRAAVTLLLAALALIALASGSILPAAAMLLLWWIFRKISNHPLLKKLKRKRK